MNRNIDAKVWKWYSKAAGATALAGAIFLAGCAGLRHRYGSEELSDRFGFTQTSIHEDDKPHLAQMVYSKAERLYRKIHGTDGYEEELAEYSKSLIEDNRDLTQYAQAIQRVLNKNRINRKLATKVKDASLYKYDDANSALLRDEDCMPVALHSFRDRTIYVAVPDQFTPKTAGHEVAHGATEKESWANYLSLKGAVESQDLEWQFSCVYHLYRTLNDPALKNPPTQCSDHYKRKWPEYHQGYLELAFGDIELWHYLNE